MTRGYRIEGDAVRVFANDLTVHPETGRLGPMWRLECASGTARLSWSTRNIEEVSDGEFLILLENPSRQGTVLAILENKLGLRELPAIARADGETYYWEERIVADDPHADEQPDPEAVKQFFARCNRCETYYQDGLGRPCGKCPPGSS